MIRSPTMDLAAQYFPCLGVHVEAKNKNKKEVKEGNHFVIFLEIVPLRVLGWTFQRHSTERKKRTMSRISRA